MSQPKRQIELRDVERLKPWERNARTHSDEQVDQIAALIREVGWTNPVLVDEDDNVLAGHGRILAARKLSQPTVPVIVLEGLSDAQKKAYVIADNKSALNAEWDHELLALELSELRDFGFNMPLIGFSAAELSDLLDATDTEAAEPSKIPDDLANEVWRQWAASLHAQITHADAGAVPQVTGLTRSYAAWHFLRALYDRKDYPRLCSLAFHPQQIATSGAACSVLDGLKAVASGEIKAERLRFILQDAMNCQQLVSTSLPFAGARMPLDFPATLARDLIDEFAPQGRVLDPCHGWGGRLVGFLLSTAECYFGNDVSPQQSDGVKQIHDTFADYVERKAVRLFCAPFEDWTAPPRTKPFDFALTSPPYFDIEQYQGGEQSHAKFGGYEAWRDGFYSVLIRKVYTLLRPDGVLALQVGSQKYPLVEDGKAIAADCGFTVVGVRVTDMVNNKTQTEDERAECVLILRKDSQPRKPRNERTKADPDIHQNRARKPRQASD